MKRLSNPLIISEKSRLKQLQVLKSAWLWAAVFAVAGSVAVFIITAAPVPNALEPEDADSLTGGAIKVQDGAASGGFAVQFTVAAMMEAQVSITGSGFNPATVKVRAGQLVTWTNNDTAQHLVASDPYPKNDALPGLVGPPLNQSESFSFTFEKTGTFTYHDDLNPFSYHGTVIVE